MPSGGSVSPNGGYRFLDVADPVSMKGGLDEVSLPNFVAAAKGAVERSGATLADVSFVCPLHMKRSMFEALLRRARRARDRAEYLDDTGHMSGVDPLLGLDRAARKGKLADGRSRAAALGRDRVHVGGDRLFAGGRPSRPGSRRVRDKGGEMRKLLLAGLAALMLTGAANAATGTSFPSGFKVPVDASLGAPVIGFGGAGPVHRTPVILLHGNNDTPFPTACNSLFGKISALGSYLLDVGYAPSEVWAFGYQGDQCDLLADNTLRSGEAHTTAANIADLDAFVHSVLRYTHAKRVDIVGHSLGGTLARAWMKQRHTGHLVRRLVTIASPHHGIVNCYPDPLNYFQLPSGGGFTPDSAVCR